MLPLITKTIKKLKLTNNKDSACLSSKNLICNYQSCFHKNHSTDSLFFFLNDQLVKSFVRDKMTGMTLICFKKVFDTIDNDIVYKKLDPVGFFEYSINWFQYYTTYRSFGDQ